MCAAGDSQATTCAGVFLAGSQPILICVSKREGDDAPPKLSQRLAGFQEHALDCRVR